MAPKTTNNNGQEKVQAQQRGWFGFGRNYFYPLGLEEWNDYQKSSGDDDYSWGIEESAASKDTTSSGDDDEAANPTSSSSSLNPLLAYQYTTEIPNKPKNNKSNSNKNSKQHPTINHEYQIVAPAACSSAASFFLSGSRHNRITMMGTIHGRVMNPLLEQQSNNNNKSWNPFMISPSTVTIAMPLPCVELAAGRHFCLARLEGGLAVLSWGAGHFGQLGHGANFGMGDSSSNSNNGNLSDDEDDEEDEENAENTSTFQATPKIIERLQPRLVGSPIVQVAAGDWHGMALSEEGTVYAWGCNRNMQCGRKSPRKSATQSSPASSAPLQMTPMPVTILDTDPDKVDDPPVAIAKIVGGKAHAVAIAKHTHRVYCWGATHYGQCASNTIGSSVRTSKYTRNTMTLPRLVESLKDVTIVDVAAGDRHTIALSQGGRVFSWGAGAEGQLGIYPPIVCTAKPRLILDLDFVAIAAGEMQPQQSPTQNQQQHALSLVPTIVSVQAGGCSSFALSSSGHVYAWGSNDAASLGLPIPPVERLPYWEVGMTPSSEERLLQVRTFDSQHNVLLPKRVDCLAHIFVEQIMLGPSHSWFLGEGRQGEKDQEAAAIGRTLFEIQQLRKKAAGETGWSRLLGSGGAGASSVSQTPAPGSGGGGAGSATNVSGRSVVSPASTMPTDDEDDVTTDSMSASMPALVGSLGQRRSTSSAAAMANDASESNSTGRRSSGRAGRRYSDTALAQRNTNSKSKHFSLTNLLRKLGGSSRKNVVTTVQSREEANSQEEDQLQDNNKRNSEGSSGGKKRFHFGSSSNHNK